MPGGHRRKSSIAILNNTDRRPHIATGWYQGSGMLSRFGFVYLAVCRLQAGFLAGGSHAETHHAAQEYRQGQQGKPELVQKHGTDHDGHHQVKTQQQDMEG